MALNDEEKNLINRLITMDMREMREYLRSNPKDAKLLQSIFKNVGKKREVENASDKQIEKAILSSYASKAYEDEGDIRNKVEYYRKKDEHLLNISRLDAIITNMTDKTSVGEKHAKAGDKPGGFKGYIFSDSHGEKPGMHTRQSLPNLNAKNIGDKPTVGNAKYMGYNNAAELKAAGKRAAEQGLLESQYDDYFGRLSGINESEFMDDFRNIYGEYIDTDDTQDIDGYLLAEGLSVKLPVEKCKTVFNIPLRTLLDYDNTEIRADIKDKDNGKSLDDYKINSGDNGLTLNYMLAYIRRVGGSKEKDFLESKIDYFMSIQDRARAGKSDNFKISFASVNSVYRKFLKYKKEQQHGR